jgi:prepilin-type N-terminal cleavage/methylation domain-containing protein
VKDSVCNRRALVARNAYTLIELLIVMAVLAAVAGLTLPAIRGPMDKSRLTGAAKQVQAAVAKSRSLAIREGAAVQFRYQIFGSRFVIERCPAPVTAPIMVMSATEGMNSTPSGLTVESAAGVDSTAGNLADTSALSTDAAMTAVLREGVLPTGVTFAPATSSELISEDITSIAATEMTVGASDTSTMSAPVVQWSEPIRFEPSGRMNDETIILQGQRDFRISVVLRGLTGTTSYTAPVRAAANPNSSLPAVPGNLNPGNAASTGATR